MASAHFQNSIRHAISSGDADSLKLLLLQCRTEYGAGALKGFSPYAMQGAINSGNIALIPTLVEGGCDLDLRAIESVLKYTRESSNNDVLDGILKGGFDVNTNLSGHMGDTLLIAITFKCQHAVKTLLSHGADPNMNRRAEIDTAVELAAKLGLASMVELLIEHGADLKNRSALHYAAMYNHSRVVEVLVHHGQDVNAVPINDELSASYFEIGWGTALHEAARAGHLEMVKLLLGLGAHKEIKDSHMKTAGEVARQSMHLDVAELLMEY